MTTPPPAESLPIDADIDGVREAYAAQAAKITTLTQANATLTTQLASADQALATAQTALTTADTGLKNAIALIMAAGVTLGSPVVTEAKPPAK